MSTERVETTSTLASEMPARPSADALTKLHRSEKPSASAISRQNPSKSSEMSEKTTWAAPRPRPPKPITPPPQPTSRSRSPAATPARSRILSRTRPSFSSISRRTSESPPWRCSASHSAQMSRLAAVCGLALGAFRRRGLHGGAWERERPRLRLRRALRLLARLVRLRLLFLLGEDLFLGGAGEQPLELILVDRLALDQDRRDPVKVGHVRLEHRLREVVRFLDHALDLVVDLPRDHAHDPFLELLLLDAFLAAPGG